jgi:anti-sigma-K factor RskA
MTDTPLTPEEEDDALAAEYVLGVLELPERLAMEARAKAEPAFAARIAAWEQHFAGLNEGYDEAPAPNLLPRIEARLFPQAARPRFNWFRLIGAAGLVASLVLAVVLVMPRAEPDFVATLARTDASLAYEARFDDGRLTVTRVAGVAAEAGRVHQLWIIAPGEAPVSLGLLDGAELALDYPLPPPGWLLAVSVEPAGGSPSGLPTGPVILTAQVGA